MPRRENTFRVDYSQFPKLLSHEDIHKFVVKELGLTRENVLLLQPSRRLGCTFVEVNTLQLAETIVSQHDNKHEFVFDGKSFKLRITMEDGAVEVRLFDLSNDVSNDQIAEYLSEYGDVLSVCDLLWDERSAFGGVKTGVRIARMVVKKNIPSLVSILGEETAVSYKGQRQTCLHCQEFVHVGIPCVQNKKLLVQKLAADQSYASVAKQLAMAKQSAKPNLPPPPERNEHPNTSRRPDAKQILETKTVPAIQQKKVMAPPAILPGYQKTTAPQATIHLSSLPISIGDKTDGNDTDNSLASQHSHTNRRTRSQRSPPGKKIRHNETSINNSRASGEETKQ